MALTVDLILSDSIAEKNNIEIGDTIISVNGVEMKDFIDYIYFESSPVMDILLRKRDGTERKIHIKKDETETLGMAFEKDGIGLYQPCVNKCIFCFIDQLPKGMRDTLYFKDDDWRLSFVMGNYVTLTNVPEREFRRILERKVSPLYISVHTTDEELRCRMLQQHVNSNLMERLEALSDAGINYYCQAVIVKGYNDGKVLDKTIEDLSRFYPHAQSLALVPVGLTKHREGLTELEMIDSDTAREVIEITERWQKKLLKEKGTRFVFCADEFYIRAGVPFPDYENYEDYSQLEDGVGMVTLFTTEVREALSEFGDTSPYKKVTLVTGKDFYPYLVECAGLCEKQFNIKINVYPVINHFFGETITVTGLLTGQDIYEQIKDKDLGDCIFLSNTMLRDRKDVFLDDMTLDELQDKLKVRCKSIDPDGYSFVEEFTK
ncbi:MAG: DUF512 domain-containing protein [Clostridia bacterium]|nr:DUF512 domain-containing protein [Clostridia bacterium]